MYPHTGESPVDLRQFPNCCGVLDLVYNPRRTALLMQAEELGIPYAEGLPMLVAQAKAAVELFTGQPVPDERTEQVLRALIARQSNVVLVGMPGCGKSTVGRELAKRLDLRFVDVDEEIVRAAGMSIPALFEAGGEPLFREWERHVTADVGKTGGAVIATGGGVVLDEQNYAPLAQNGHIVWLTRPLAQLATEGRPLSKDIAALETMYRVRAPRYTRFADLTVENCDTPDRTAEEILCRLREAAPLGAPKGVTA
jgi:shikimate dehydrogenase